MNHYTAERLFIERQREMIDAAEARSRLMPPIEGSALAGGRAQGALRVWVAARLRAVADRIDGEPQLQRI